MSYEFSDGELAALDSIKTSLKKVDDWPLDSPLAFVTTLASRTKGVLGEKLIETVARSNGIPAGAGGTADFDVKVGRSRIEVKFSTEDPPRFQQVRDPRRDDGTTKYDLLIGISGRPEKLTYWVIDAETVGHLMDGGSISVQHAMSDTKWFFPHRFQTDEFSKFRCDLPGLVAQLKSLGE